MLVESFLPRTELPQDGARLDPANPLARLFQVAYLPAVSQENLGFGGSGTLPSHGLARVASPAGPSLFHTGAGGQITSGRNFGPTPSYPLTAVFVCRQGSTANSILAGVTASSSISGSYWYVGGGSSTTMTLYGRNSFSSAMSVAVTVPTPPDGSLQPALNNDLVIVAQSLSASNHRICVNGSAVATSTTNISSMVAWDRMFLGVASGNLNLSAALFGHGGVGLSDAEMQILSRSPREVWALFEPQRFYVPVAVAGGGGSFKAAWVRNRSQVIGAGMR